MVENSLDAILRNYLEHRDTLSDAEFQLLLETLRTNPQLAEQVKDHLVMDEMLSQEYTDSRKNFVEKFQSRLERELREEETSKESARSSETYSLRIPEADRLVTRSPGHPKSNGNGTQPQASPAVRPAKPKSKPLSHRVRSDASSGSWKGVVFALLGLLICAGGLFYLEMTPAARRIASVQSVSGLVFIYRDGVGTVAAPGMWVLPGDTIQSQADATATVIYRDRTTLAIRPDSQMILQPGSEQMPGILTQHHAKAVRVKQGTLVADVEPQPIGSPMTVETEHCKVEVVGTRFLVTAEQETSRVEVIEGEVSVKGGPADVPPVSVQSGQQVVASPNSVQVEPGNWPTNREGLVFLLSPDAELKQSVDEGVQLLAEGIDESPVVLRPRGLAGFEEGELVFEDGAFLAEEGFNPLLLEVFQAGNELTIETTFQTHELSQTGPARWMTYSTNSNSLNFSLTQERKHIVLRLLTGTGRKQHKNEIKLCEIPDTEKHHFAVTYREGELSCYLDGTPIDIEKTVTGNFAKWKTEHLLFGDEWNAERAWKGRLSGIAIYARALSQEEITRNVLHFRLRFLDRDKAPPEN